MKIIDPDSLKNRINEKTVEAFDQSISEEDLKDVVAFYLEEMKLNGQIRLYNSLIKDDYMKELQIISDSHCKAYFEQLLNLMKRKVN